MGSRYAIQFALLMTFFFSQLGLGASGENKARIKEVLKVSEELQQVNKNPESPLVRETFLNLEQQLCLLEAEAKLVTANHALLMARMKANALKYHGKKARKAKKFLHKRAVFTRHYCRKLESRKRPILKAYKTKSIKAYLNKVDDFVRDELKAREIYDKKMAKILDKMQASGVFSVL